MLAEIHQDIYKHCQKCCWTSLEKKEFTLNLDVGQDDAIVEITLSTVCGSDLHTWLGYRPFPTPCILGHEMVGKILHIGKNLTKDYTGQELKIGDKVVWSMTVGCGECFFCKKKLPQKCTNMFKYGHEKSDQRPHFTGGFAKYVYLKEGTNIFKVSPELSDEEVAPLMCAASTITSGLHYGNFQKCDYVIVQGCGALGMYACAFTKQLGAKKVIAIDFNDNRLELAKQFGADYTINPKNVRKNIIDEIMKITKNRGADVIIEITGQPSVIKEGIHEDFTNRDKILEVCRFKSSESDKLISLDDYVSRMKDGQEKIYYVSGEDENKLSQSPHLEGFKAKGIEVIYMTDPVDEFWLPSVGKFSEKDFQSITKGGADLDKIKSDKKSKEKKKDNKNIDKLIASIKVALGDEVKEVKTSDRLTDSAVCLVAGEGDMDMHLEKLLKQHQQIDSTSQKILEVNPDHPLIKDLLKIVNNDNDKQVFDDASWLLLDQARIIEGQPVSDPNKFAKRMNTLLQKGIGL